MQGFRLVFTLITLARIASALLNFSAVYLLGDVISKLSAISLERFFWFYAPLWLGIMLAKEILDYFTRKYAEACVDYGTVSSSFHLRLPTIRRLGIREF